MQKLVRQQDDALLTIKGQLDSSEDDINLRQVVTTEDTTVAVSTNAVLIYWTTTDNHLVIVTLIDTVFGVEVLCVHGDDTLTWELFIAVQQDKLLATLERGKVRLGFLKERTN